MSSGEERRAADEQAARLAALLQALRSDSQSVLSNTPGAELAPSAAPFRLPEQGNSRPPNLLTLHDRPTPAPQPLWSPDTQMSHYRLVEVVGQGGMGVVYKAEDTQLGRTVAIKVLSPELSGDPEFLARFHHEARTASALNHPGIATVHELGCHEGQPFLVMEWIDGYSLRSLVAQKPDVETLARLIGQVAQALAAAHGVGIVHRDLKPENLMVRADGYVKILDFGLAQGLPASLLPGPAAPMPKTDPGVVVGTVQYMSPEQGRGDRVQAPSDLFSLGIVLYELATGIHPFPVDSPLGVLFAIQTRPAIPPGRVNPALGPALDSLVLRMLAKEPRHRPTASEVACVLLELARTTPTAPVRPPRTIQRLTVGRGLELNQLRTQWQMATQGKGGIACVTGEAGIGKTTLVEDFLDEAGSGECRLARGRCSERLAGAEAYLPILEALESLLQDDYSGGVASVMSQLATAWYAQVAPRTGQEKGEIAAASQERLKREWIALLGELSRESPLLLFLDDLHWADPSTVDLLAYLGGKIAGLRVFLLATYRPSDLLLSRHPFAAVKLDLQSRGVCREVSLPFLSRQDVDRYLALVFPHHAFPPHFAALIHARTEGSPLFMADLLRYLRECESIVEREGGWCLAESLPESRLDLPESVRALIQRKIEQLADPDRLLLVAASVQGHEFDAAVVARVLAREPAEVEERLETLDRMHGMVRFVREQEFADGTLTLRYAFVHVLYQNALDASLKGSRRTSAFASTAAAIETFHAPNRAALAGELALLWESARDWGRAAEAFGLAAGHALPVSAYAESALLARRGLEMAARLPDSPARGQLELMLQLTLGGVCTATEGYGSAHVQEVFGRARQLCQQLGSAAQVFPVLWGLWSYSYIRAELRTARELAEQLLEVAERDGQRASRLGAHYELGLTLFHTGEFVAALDHLDRGIALHDCGLDRSLILHSQLSFGMTCLSYSALALWMLHREDEAVGRNELALDLARTLNHPHTTAGALTFSCWFHQLRHDADSARRDAEASLALCSEHGFPFWAAIATVIRGWALAQHGAKAEGIAALREGMACYRATGANLARPFQTLMLIEALLANDQSRDALAEIDEALRDADPDGDRSCDAELHRLRGELLGDEASLQEALRMARRQGAREWEARAEASLSQLLQRQGRQAETHTLPDALS